MVIKALVLAFVALCEFAYCKDNNYMPRFLAEPQSAIVRTGSSVLLHCSVEPEATSVRWMVNGSFVTSQRRRGFDLRDGNSLRIVSFNHPDTLSHEGIYQCLATNAIGSVLSREAKLEAAVLGAYVGPHTVMDVTVIEGNVAVLPCSLPESRPRAVVEFLHNGTKLFPSARHVFLPSGNLQIARVTASDQGLYQCSALNTVIGNSVPSPVSFRLRVTVPRSDVAPVFTATPSESVTVNQGSNLTLECSADGWPVPQVTWEKYGGHLPVGRFSQVLGNLVISRIQRFDAGTYLCRVTNAKANDQSLDMVINVDVLEPPTIETAPEDQSGTEGSTVVFKCRPLGSPKQGSPKPSIQWVFNGELIVNEQFVAVRDTTLTLSNIRRRQQGIYQCIVRNGLGMAHAAARLTVGDQQGQPRGTPSSAASPTYGPGQPDPNVNDDYEDVDEEEEDEYDLYDSDNGSWNFETGGDFAEDRPGPSKPKVSVLSNSSVVVSWQMAAASSQGVPAVEMFKIKVKEIGEESSSKWTTIDDDVSYGLRMFEVRGLKTGKTYRFRVVVIYADNERKVGPVSAKVTLTSGSGGTPGKTRMPAPVIVEAHSVSKNKVYIGWQQPDIDQWPVESFFVYFNPYDKDSNVRKVKLPGTSLRNYVLSDLIPGTAYSIRMRSFGKMGVKSSFSNTVVKETQGDDGVELPNNFPVARHVSTVKPDGVNRPVQAEDHELTRDVISDQDPDRQLTYVIIGIVLGVVVIVAVSGTFVCVWKKQHKQQCADGELKHVEQTTAFLSPATEAANGLVSINDYAYKTERGGGHLPNCGGDCSLDKTPAGGNGVCPAARDGRGHGCAGKAPAKQRKMAPDLVLPSPPSTAPPFHQYRAANPEMTIYDSVDDEDRGKASPTYAKVSSLDSMSTGAFPSQEVLGNPSRSTADAMPSKALVDGHAYWVLDQSRNQSLPERIANRVDQAPSSSSHQSPFRQAMSASQPCNKMAKTGFERGDPGRRRDEDLDQYEHMVPLTSPFNKALLPSTPAAYGEGNQPNNSCDAPLSWPSAGSGRNPPNADRYLLQEQPQNGRRMQVAKPTTDPVTFSTNVQKEPGQDSWKALTNQVSNGQYRIQPGPGTNGPLTASFSLPRANDYPSSDQEDCR